jgi:hypothetical protein
LTLPLARVPLKSINQQYQCLGKILSMKLKKTLVPTQALRIKTRNLKSIHDDSHWDSLHREGNPVKSQAYYKNQRGSSSNFKLNDTLASCELSSQVDCTIFSSGCVIKTVKKLNDIGYIGFIGIMALSCYRKRIYCIHITSNKITFNESRFLLSLISFGICI